MPRYPNNLQGFTAQVCGLRQKAVQIEINSLGFPLFVYSYSSLGFPDLSERYSATRHLVPIQLVSLYDIHYHLGHLDIFNTLQVKSGINVFDSGQYEAEGLKSTWKTGQIEQQPWSKELYIENAKKVVHEGDILVSYDNRSLDLIDQIKESQALFADIGVLDVKRDLLLHPNGISPTVLAEAVAKLAPDVDFIGLTEKDIGFPWFIAVSYIRQLRTKLDSILDRYIPIHIFGCFDPQTIPYLFFAGADIFDGLAWMRYYFRDGHAFYDKEYTYDTSPEELLKPDEALLSLLAHNVEELERLRADLRYSILTNDLSQFGKCLENLKALELADTAKNTASNKRAKSTTGEKNGR